jgi:hypothetical protein
MGKRGCAKALFLTFFMFAGIAGVFGQFEGGSFGIGVRAIGIVPFYEAGTDIKDFASGYAVDLESKLNFGFALQVSYQFTNLLGLQIEGIYNTDEIDMAVQEIKIASAKGTSIQLPILLKIGGVMGSSIYLGGIAGLYFTLPTGDGELTSVKFGSYTSKWEGPIGLMAGGVIGIVLGPGMLFTDIRYGMDFSEVEFEYDNSPKAVFKKSNLGIGLGYALSLW